MSAAIVFQTLNINIFIKTFVHVYVKKTFLWCIEFRKLTVKFIVSLIKFTPKLRRKI